MRLQLDPEDDEAEQRIRMGIERDSQNGLERALQRQKNDLIPATATEEQIASAASRVNETSGPVRDVLRRMLQASADLGVNVAIDQFENIGFGFDWTLANQSAAEWVQSGIHRLTDEINSTTERRMRTAITEWIQNGDPLSKLRQELERVVFSPQRAELIASTEVTRAYAEGNRIAYRESGVVDEIEWRTANDEKVCPICGPLHEERGGVDEGVHELFPPAHPRCRCWIVPVVA